MPSLVNIVFDHCFIADTYNPNRNRSSVFRAITAEVGELAEEVDIAEGTSYKKAGPDGIVGEAIDVIVSALDIIYQERPDMGADEIAQIAAAKCEKWIDSLKKQAKAQNPKT